jgi:hypothetical protein
LQYYGAMWPPSGPLRFRSLRPWLGRPLVVGVETGGHWALTRSKTEKRSDGAVPTARALFSSTRGPLEACRNGFTGCLWALSHSVTRSDNPLRRVAVAEVLLRTSCVSPSLNFVGSERQQCESWREGGRTFLPERFGCSSSCEAFTSPLERRVICRSVSRAATDQSNARAA